MKKVLLLLMILCLIFPVVSFADSGSYDNENKLPPTIDAFSAEKENEKLESLGYLDSKGYLKLDKDKPIVIEFEDGSSIEYSVKKEENSLFDDHATVYKNYQYGVAQVKVNITVYKQSSGRSITITDAFTTLTGHHFTENDKRTKIIQPTGYGTNYAKVRVNGSFTLTIPWQGSGYYTRAFLLEAHADPAGYLYLRTIE